MKSAETGVVTNVVTNAVTSVVTNATAGAVGNVIAYDATDISSSSELVRPLLCASSDFGRISCGSALKPPPTGVHAIDCCSVYFDDLYLHPEDNLSRSRSYAMVAAPSDWSLSGWNDISSCSSHSCHQRYISHSHACSPLSQASRGPILSPASFSGRSAGPEGISFLRIDAFAGLAPSKHVHGDDVLELASPTTLV